MGFLGKKPPPKTLAAAQRTPGQLAEDAALQHAQARGWRLIARNYRTPGRGGGEIDLILRTGDGVVVFVEVRSRSLQDYGGAGGSIDATKRRRIVLAARHWLARQPSLPRCRFDAVLVQGMQLQWLEAAFDAE
ncbi:YraN family protein [Comamonas sp. GB3 AK4-5]|uniref:YraN family protein n=1 Tax=Comamonas sp. GB3 AK4-5 TaxID=3231487 RepID=UPI00351ED67A